LASTCVIVPPERATLRTFVPRPLMFGWRDFLREHGSISDAIDFGRYPNHTPSAANIEFQLLTPAPFGAASSVTDDDVVATLGSRSLPKEAVLVLWLECPAGAERARSVVDRLRGQHPEVSLMAAGPLVDRFEKSKPGWLRPFHGLVPTRLLPTFAKRLTAETITPARIRSAWPPKRTRHAAFDSCALWNMAHDDSERTEFLSRGKLRLWPIGPRAEADAPEAGTGDPWFALQADARSHGVDWCTYWSAPSWPSRQLAGFWNTLLIRNEHGVQAIRAGAESLSTASMRTAAANGCVAVEIDAITGSQRLLSDFYGSPGSTSRSIGLLRSARDAGLDTLVRLTYPCPDDDMHTFEETVRLIRLGRPDAVLIAAPELNPAAPWWECPSAYGFQVRSHSTVAKAHARSTSDTATLRYTMNGWSADAIRDARRLLAQASVDSGCNVYAAGEDWLAESLVRLAGGTLPERTNGRPYDDAQSIDILIAETNAAINRLSAARASDGDRAAAAAGQ